MLSKTAKLLLPLLVSFSFASPLFASQPIINILMLRSEDFKSEALFDLTASKFEYTPPNNSGGSYFLSSLFIPGWGQYRQGRKNTALAFFGFELTMWSGIFAVKTYGQWLENDYRTYAILHADINPQGKNHAFYVNIGNYDSVDQFNQVQQLERDYDALYLSDEYYWRWDSPVNRGKFEDLRILSDSYQHSSMYFAGAIVLNHLVSAVEAAKHTPATENLHFGVRINPSGKQMLTIIKGF
jgi:hypothetical protein